MDWALGQSDLGPFRLAATQKGVCFLGFDDGPFGRIGPIATSYIPIIKAAIAAPWNAHTVPLDIVGTAFQRRVWDAVCDIPPGETRTYQDIARLLERPGAARAVGRANGTNPVAVLIPCHRVVRTDGTLGGYAYGLDRKRALLEKERDYKKT